MIDRDLLRRKFARIGARLKVVETDATRGLPFTVDVARDRRGEVFELRVHPDQGAGLELVVQDLRPSDRHLLLMGRNPSERSGVWERMLCGHDERHWFVAGVEGASSVDAAKEALKPEIVIEAQARAGLKGRRRHRRRNPAFIRQGEWFFLPAPHLAPPPELILRHEPIRRGRGTPHMVEELYREGGESVWVSQRHPDGISPSQRTALLARDPGARQLRWRVMHRVAQAYGRGRVTHRDHATVVLPFWHRIVLSAEGATGVVTFLD